MKYLFCKCELKCSKNVKINSLHYLVVFCKSHRNKTIPDIWTVVFLTNEQAKSISQNNTENKTIR